MIKLRQAGYCNLKLLLLYLVVYGHWIETSIGNSEIVLVQYRIIYLVHMPLFAFLSGLFLRNEGDCVRQIRRLLPLYGALQLTVVALEGLTNVSKTPIKTLLAESVAELWTPFWHLWYLLSYCIWAAIGWLWFRFWKEKNKADDTQEKDKVDFIKEKGKGKQQTFFNQAGIAVTILILSILTGALAGYIPWLDRALSGSRTIVFFPYFWTGLICKPDISWSKYRIRGLASLGAAVVVLLMIGNDIPVTFLYHADPYKASMRTLDMVKLAEASDICEQVRILLQNGFVLRLLCYILSSLLGFFLLTAIPDKCLPCTKAGVDTMFGYLMHAPIVAALRVLNQSWGVCAIFSAVLLYVIYKLLQWNSSLYGVREKSSKEDVYT